MAAPNVYEPDENLKKMRNQFFQSRKNEAQQAATAQTQSGSDAIQRRFASMGASGSGAQIAAMQKNQEAGLDAQRKALSDVGSMELQSAESDLGRQFQSGMADKDISFKRELSGIEQGNKLKELDLAERQFSLDKDTTEFNRRLAEIEAGAPAPAGPLDTLGKNIENIPKDIGKVLSNMPTVGNAVARATGSKELGMIADPIGSIGNVISGGK
jgi:hypothetical protein